MKKNMNRMFSSDIRQQFKAIESIGKAWRKIMDVRSKETARVRVGVGVRAGANVGEGR